MNNDMYMCQDMWEAAYLIAMGIRLQRLEVQDGMITLVWNNQDGRAAQEGQRFGNGNPLAPSRSLLKGWKLINWKVRQARRGIAA